MFRGNYSKTAEAKEMGTRTPSTSIGSTEEKLVECVLRVTNYTIWATPVVDRKMPEIKIPNWSHCRGCFDQDIVSVKVAVERNGGIDDDDDIKYIGKVVNKIKSSLCLENIDIVCVADTVKVGLMIPLDRSFPKFWVGCENMILIEHCSDGTKKHHRLVRFIDPDKVFLVRYDSWKQDKYYPSGKIVGTKPYGLDLCAATELLNSTYGVDTATNLYVEKEINLLVDDFKKTQGNHVNTVDNSSLFCFTIDPSNSKYMDDALSLQDKNKDSYIVGVHIADVSLFIKCGAEGTTQENGIKSLNDYAYRKGISLYPKDSESIPMLPRELIENYLSLKPNECRNVVSVYLEISKSTEEIVGHDIKREIVKSKKKFTYDEAEEVIGTTDDDGGDYDDDVDDKNLKQNLKILYNLAEKLHMRRNCVVKVKDWNAPRKKSRFLIKEFMIQTNFLVAKLMKEMCNGKSLLYIQQPPLEKKLLNLQNCFKQVNSLLLQFSNNSIHARQLEIDTVQILVSVWRQIMHFVKNDQMETAITYLCSESAYPFLIHSTVATERTKYSISADCKDSSVHFDLNLDPYTHFTSPIRSYMDIVVHRLLLDGLNLSSETLNYCENTLRTICDHCSRALVKKNEYKKAMYGLKNALTWIKKPVVMEAVICDITETEIKLEYPKLNRFIQTINYLKFRSLQLNQNPVFNEMEKEVSLVWRKRIYHYNHRPDEAGEYKDEVALSAKNHVITLDKEDWCKILLKLKSPGGDQLEQLKQAITKTDQAVQNQYKPLAADFSCELNDRIKKKVRKIITTADDKNNEDEVKHRCRNLLISANFSRGTTVEVQLGCKLSRGIISPSIQLLKLAKSLSICLEHQLDPFLQFCLPITYREIKGYKFSDCLKYQLHWLPLINIAAAYNSVKCKDNSVRIADVEVTWEKQTDKIFAVFFLSKTFITERQIWFNRSFCNIEDFLKLHQRIDYFCIEVPLKKWSWVAHCVSVAVIEDIQRDALKFRCLWSSVHSTRVEPPESIFQKSSKCIVELIATQLPERRMQETLFNLHKASELAQNIALGVPCGLYLKHFSLDENVVISQELNSGQRNAIAHALNSTFSTIWGPPGTGKTKTAVELACCFVRQNKKRDNCSKVVFCAPSNKAVNVVGKMFVDKNKDINVLRIYARSTERNIYPLPFDSTPTANDNYDKCLNKITMHERIRDTESKNPHASNIKRVYQILEKIKIALENGESAPKNVFDRLNEYKELVKRAEKWEIENADVLLMTCITASKNRLQLVSSGDVKKFSYTVEQLIIDECGMCTEPETLVPIVATECQQVVLVGDHMQLAPIVKSKQLEELGMGRSLFARYTTTKDMLVQQYRMHEALMAFPSKQFYHNKLQLGNSNEQSLPSRLTFWPAGPHYPLVFLHCVGKEEKTVVTTDESAEMSCKNETEADYAMIILKHLIQNCKVKPSDVTFISPYRAQLQLVKSKISNDNFLKGCEPRTIVKSQGDQWNYVILSTVRSVESDTVDGTPSTSWGNTQLGSVADPHQINVALTRSRLGLFIIGNRNLLEVNKVWKSLLDDYSQKHCICDAKMFCHNL